MAADLVTGEVTHSAFPTEGGQASSSGSHYRIVRTLRLRNENHPGVLG